MIYGNTSGIKKKEYHLLERLYRKRLNSRGVITPEFAKQLVSLSNQLNRQIGVLISRAGDICFVIVGDTKGIFIPDLSNYPIGRKPLRGLRLIHTHLYNEPLNKDDLTDLALLRLDMIVAIGIKNGAPEDVYIAHLLPEGGDKMIEVLPGYKIYNIPMDFSSFIKSLEEQMSRRHQFSQEDLRERAILVSASTRPRYEMEESLDELEELALSADVNVIGRVVQRLKKVNPRYLMGEGKIKELIIDALSKGATLLIFDQDLTPSQIRAITDVTELKVIDRTQLILDIFARRAHTRDGKVQVELAQLRYRLPRLTGKGTAMSRLAGGIGGRGPGETKLEIDRRRVRDRIHLLERELEKLKKARLQRKHKRISAGVPIVSIIGYTNAGKSTLLNNLTKSLVYAEDKMFATLDTSTRRLRFPKDRDIIITDTVGFIRDLPEDLVVAFRATLEELHDADLLLHMVDISNPRFEQQIESVENILKDLNLLDKPRILVFNKIDRVPREEAENICDRYGGVCISALDRKTFGSLLESIEQELWREKVHH